MADEIELEAAIRRNSDGEVRLDRYPANPENVTHQVFWWRDGNAACDCNRHLFFERAGGVEVDDDEDIDCSRNLYSVVSLTRCDTGEVIYREGA